MKSIKLPATFEFEVSQKRDLIVSIGRSVYFSSLVTMKRIGKCHPFPHPSNLDISPDGKVVLIKSTSGALALIDTAEMGVINILSTKLDSEGCAAKFSPCGNYIVDGSWNGLIAVRDLDGNFVEKRQYENEMISSLGCSQDRTKWLVFRNNKYPHNGGVTIELWEWPFTYKNISNCKITELPARKAVISPCGELVAIFHHDKIVIMQLASGGDICTIKRESGGSGDSFYWFKDSNKVAYNNRLGFEIYSLDSKSVEWKSEQKYPSCINVLENENLIALGTWECGIVRAFT